MIDKIISHVRDREYMSGIEREHLRVKATGEVFTPTHLVQQMLDKLDQAIFTDPKKTFLDPACGDGQFIGEALIRKVENGIDFEQALSTIYGVDLMQDNIDLCRERLLCGREDLRHIVEKNIVCADSLRYHYRFDNSPPYQKTPEEYEEIIANHKAEKHQMHKRLGGKNAEIKKLKAEAATFAEERKLQKALRKENEKLHKESEKKDREIEKLREKSEKQDREIEKLRRELKPKNNYPDIFAE